MFARVLVAPAPRSPGRAGLARLGVERLEDRSTPAVTARFDVFSDWVTAFQGQIRLDNSGPAAVTNWRLEFDFDRTIYNIWNARIVSHAGNHYVIDNAGYNGTIGVNAGQAFGFLGKPRRSQGGPLELRPQRRAPRRGWGRRRGLSDRVRFPGHGPEGDTGRTPATFAVTLSAVSTSPVRVNYATSAGSAGIADFAPVSGILTFNPGETSRTVAVSILGDLLDEPDEDFTLSLSSPTNANARHGPGPGDDPRQRPGPGPVRRRCDRDGADGRDRDGGRLLPHVRQPDRRRRRQGGADRRRQLVRHGDDAPTPRTDSGPAATRR